MEQLIEGSLLQCLNYIFINITYQILSLVFRSLFFLQNIRTAGNQLQENLNIFNVFILWLYSIK